MSGDAQVMTPILNRSSTPSAKDFARLAVRAERIMRDLDSPDVKQLRKDAGKLAREVRTHASTMLDRTTEGATVAGDRVSRVKTQAKAHAPSRKELDQRREAMMQKVVATAGVVLPLVPAIARKAVTHKRTRRAAMAAPMVAARTHPVVLGASLVGAGFVGYRVWKRHSAKQAEQARRNERHDDFVVARMEGEGGAIGAYDADPRSISSVGSRGSNGFR